MATVETDITRTVKDSDNQLAGWIEEEMGVFKFSPHSGANNLSSVDVYEIAEELFSLNDSEFKPQLVNR